MRNFTGLLFTCPLLRISVLPILRPCGWAVMGYSVVGISCTGGEDRHQCFVEACPACITSGNALVGEEQRVS